MKSKKSCNYFDACGSAENCARCTGYEKRIPEGSQAETRDTMKTRKEKREVPKGLQFDTLLKEAVNKPGTISAAYRAFHGFSIGNQVAAMWQCSANDIDLGPICTFKGWKDKGRKVNKGEKALFLCMPVTCKTTRTNKDTGEDEDAAFTRFIWRPRWFVLSQTSGEDVPTVAMPEWDQDKALKALEIALLPFEGLNGNCMGYASTEGIALNPMNPNKHKTLFHELAHVLLGHTKEGTLHDSSSTPKELKEAEAEAVAMVLCETLELPGTESSRAYIQGWYGVGHEIPEKSARKIFSAANKILKAGQLDA